MNDSLEKFKDRKRHHENKERDKAKDHHRKEKREQKHEVTVEVYPDFVRMRIP